MLKIFSKAWKIWSKINSDFFIKIWKCVKINLVGVNTSTTIIRLSAWSILNYNIISITSKDLIITCTCLENIIVISAIYSIITWSGGNNVISRITKYIVYTWTSSYNIIAWSSINFTKAIITYCNYFTIVLTNNNNILLPKPQSSNV